MFNKAIKFSGIITLIALFVFTLFSSSVNGERNEHRHNEVEYHIRVDSKTPRIETVIN